MVQKKDMSFEELKNYKPDLTKECDFTEYWGKTLTLLSEVEIRYELVKYDYPVKRVKLYKITFSGYMNANIDGWFAIPDSDEIHPGIVVYHGYNWAFDGCIHETVNLALHGYAVLHMLVRGQQGGSIDNIITSHGNYSGWLSKGILSKEEYYYRAVFMDCVRAIEVLERLENVDRNRIGVIGGSQGGGLALAVAALSEIPRVVVSKSPLLSDFNRAIEISETMPYCEIKEFLKRNPGDLIEAKVRQTLTYFDLINHVSNIKCPVLLAVGLVDEIVPPSTAYAVYNHLSCTKKIETYSYFGHEDISEFVTKQLQMLMQHLV